MVDDEFQLSVRNIFNVNKMNGIGYLTLDEKNTTTTATATTTLSIDMLNDFMTKTDNETKTDENDSDTTGNSSNNSNLDMNNVIEYTRGPVKLYSRALSKSENEYQNELYQTSASVLDFNRCTLTFISIATL